MADLPTPIAEEVSVLGANTQQATGLAPGDVVFQVNRQRVASADELRQAVAGAAGNQAVTVWFERGGMIGHSAFYVR